MGVRDDGPRYGPFEDDFNDGNYTGWTAVGTWSASNGYATRSSSTGMLTRSTSDDDFEMWFSYMNEDTSSGSYQADVGPEAGLPIRQRRE